MQRANILNAFLVAALGVGECREAAAAQRANAANLAGRDHLGRELVSASEAGGEKGRQGRQQPFHNSTPSGMKAE